MPGSWIDSSVIGSGGHDLIKGTDCKIRAASSTSEKVGRVQKVTLDVEFLSSSTRKTWQMYATGLDRQYLWSPWSHWGWWYAP